MPSKLTLVFDQNTLPTADIDTVVLRDGLSGNQLFMRFVTLRVAQYQSTIGSFYAECRGNFRNSFLADYNSLNVYTVEYGGTTDLHITHPNSGHFQQANVSILTDGIVSATVENTADPSEIEVSNIEWIQAGSNQCNEVIARVTTTSLATEITSPVNISGNTNNPFDLTVQRGTFINISGSNADDKTFSQGVITVGKLMEASLSVSVINSPNGSTATATIPQPNEATLEYSINNTDWQSSNSFPSLIPGNYTMYVRDNFGCQVSKPFTVVEFESEGIGVTSPVADLPSKSNSIRFFRQKADSELAIDENVMSCNTPFVKARMDIQKFKNSQEVSIQIRSNYETISVDVKDNLDNDYVIPVQKITSNVGLQDSRDALIYELPDGQAGIYFTSGNKYTYGTSTVSGSYALNGALPGWGRIGNYIAIGNAWYEIVDIGYSEEKSAEVLVINYVYTDPEATIQVGCIYNSQDYEVYEFLVDFSLYQNKYIQLTITETDSKTDYPDVVFKSEIIQTADSFNKHVELTYWNEENSGNILYSTGIKHIINLPLVYSQGYASEDSESDKTDTSAYLIESSVHEGDEFKFGWISKGMFRKLALAVNHDFWEINGVQYVKDGDMESGGVTLTNQYAPLIKGIKQVTHTLLNKQVIAMLLQLRCRT